MLALLLAFVAPSLLAAQESFDLPALYDVSGVASNDTLNVRAGPTVNAPVLDELGPERDGIEVLAFDGDRKWGRINIGEGAGWVSMAYMSRQPGQNPVSKLPVPLFCGGTEPFWSLEIGQGQVTFTDPGMDADPLVQEIEYEGTVPWSPRGAIVAGDITGFVSREACSDGMSDRQYGWRIDFLRSGNGGHFMFSGCCSLQN
ncbi:SH3 domain-containing protein [Maritimibacter sp. UBA3975]|uniref:COG3650 family protein n=1 Tax=Maritimibacter sp. UBA3975 TaxID=1946833 RepID=UPI000C0AC564|nr:SH3 domain-containing protein [Maritimibacter sp. UBA3975]MAM63478.1 hypothetical protein [Maritimibacter sp.]|tara:strand:+ start:131915 stop:132517 length:603 start_codon:yes stop_codon:yes gene_type:complete